MSFESLMNSWDEFSNRDLRKAVWSLHDIANIVKKMIGCSLWPKYLTYLTF